MNTPEVAIDSRPHILNLDAAQVREWLKEHGYPAFRVGQLLGWIYQRRAESFEAMSDLPKAMRVELEQSFRLWTAEVAAHQQADDGTEKLLLRLSDGVLIELLLPNGQTQQLRGPLRARYAATAPPAPSMISAFVAMFKARASNERLGGVRNSDAQCVSDSRNDWATIATGWNAGCRREALAQLDARLK